MQLGPLFSEDQWNDKWLIMSNNEQKHPRNMSLCGHRISQMTQSRSNSPVCFSNWSARDTICEPNLQGPEKKMSLSCQKGKETVTDKKSNTFHKLAQSEPGESLFKQSQVNDAYGVYQHYIALRRVSISSTNSWQGVFFTCCLFHIFLSKGHVR